ncbi:hypothetical protein BO86DRAFT_402163 [Aspergillus japonicus CBS 114.51]|uniref:Uncharacterized protein n=2 Tax=Aspergillus TaxID=5052 RepID=A0A2V5H2W0_ASPV1|nr:hypothetical protein BO86DRAFT_402163 [Aspergillus japonicus CBS 114.51]PYI17921.1 hypothetical protein BO99DRAFT_434109 [Aspergillus violaceofuscus CBS 115571]RAH79139.1 hypothetical protein BO86DRAFT_402163 [Aspergillus japonicus CBS 114.51]
MRFALWSTALLVGCMAAPMLPTHPLIVRRELTENGEVCVRKPHFRPIKNSINAYSRDQKEKRDNDEPLTSDGDVDPVNDGEVNNNISLIRLC